MVRNAAAEALCRQTTLPEAIFKGLARLLDYRDDGIRSAVAEDLSRQTTLPETILEDLLRWIRNEDCWVRNDTIRVPLNQQPRLPNGNIGGLVQRLEHEDYIIRYAIAEASSRQISLSEFHARRLGDADYLVRNAAAQALGRQAPPSEKIFFTFLINTKSQGFKDVYCAWLERSFREDVIWYFESEEFCLHVINGFKEIFEAFGSAAIS